MYKIEKYEIATYKKALYGQTPTKYLVPLKIVHYKFDETIGDYVKDKTYEGRTECGNILHEVRHKHKNYLKSLNANNDPLYDVEMTKHKNKEGFWDPSNTNYNARRMVEDDGFMPCGNKWKKKQWPWNKWSNNKLIPNYNEPYWHTEHSIIKSNDWIFEHLDHMQDRVRQDIINKDEYKVIHEHLEDCILDLTAN
tara:strand:- start:355 stop:939 length:585 start_codon:yes stop_codon:yes gene_type:complete